MSEKEILGASNKDNMNILEVKNNKEFIDCADNLFEELKSYLAVEDRDLKAIWNMNNWPAAMSGLYQYIKAGMTDPNNVVRRSTLLQMLAYTVVCYRTLNQDPNEIKDAQARITQSSVDEGDKKDNLKQAKEAAARQALLEALKD